MFVPIKRVNKDYELPKYQTNGSVGFDFITREKVTILAGEIALIPANNVIQVPAGYMLMVALRSSAPRKWGIMMPQGVGIIDQDYCGPEDEIKIQVLNFNFKSTSVTIPAGTRLAQGVFYKVGVVDHWKECDDEDLENLSRFHKSRGGFGSTG